MGPGWRLETPSEEKQQERDKNKEDKSWLISDRKKMTPGEYLHMPLRWTLFYEVSYSEDLTCTLLDG